MGSVSALSPSLRFISSNDRLSKDVRVMAHNPRLSCVVICQHEAYTDGVCSGRLFHVFWKVVPCDSFSTA